MNNSIKVFLQFCVLFVLIIATSGCSPIVIIEIEKYISYPVLKKIPLKIELLLTEKFRSSGDVSYGRKYVIGRGLSENAKVLAEALFEHVTVTSSEAAVPTKAEAVLIPSLLAFRSTIPNLLWNDSKTILDIKWSLRDPDGKILWVSTIRGEGHGPYNKKYIQMVIDDLFQKTFQRMSSSPEIRNYAISQ